MPTLFTVSAGLLGCQQLRPLARAQQTKSAEVPIRRCNKAMNGLACFGSRPHTASARSGEAANTTSSEEDNMVASDPPPAEPTIRSHGLVPIERNLRSVRPERL